MGPFSAAFIHFHVVDQLDLIKADNQGHMMCLTAWFLNLSDDVLDSAFLWSQNVQTVFLCQIDL